jgi:hypothetical protein
VAGPQPRGSHLGTIGPDQGYAYRLVPLVEEAASYGSVERDDAVAGCVAVAMKRAALFGRAPVIHDLTAAFTVFGFLDDDPPAELVELRDELFTEVHRAHHYPKLRDLVDLVPDDALRRPPSAITADYRSDWRANLRLDEGG